MVAQKSAGRASKMLARACSWYPKVQRRRVKSCAQELQRWHVEARGPVRSNCSGLTPSQLLGVVTTLRRRFDLDANPQAIADTFHHDAVLGPLIARRPGLRLPGGWEGFEIAVRAILGQQISVAAARTLATRIVQRYGEPLSVVSVPGLERLFPTAAALANVDLREIGVTTAPGPIAMTSMP